MFQETCEVTFRLNTVRVKKKKKKHTTITFFPFPSEVLHTLKLCDVLCTASFRTRTTNKDVLTEWTLLYPLVRKCEHVLLRMHKANKQKKSCKGKPIVHVESIFALPPFFLLSPHPPPPRSPQAPETKTVSLTASISQYEGGDEKVDKAIHFRCPARVSKTRLRTVELELCVS